MRISDWSSDVCSSDLESKTLPLPGIEEKLDKIVRVKGEDGLNELRDKARQVALVLGMDKEFGKLDRMIGAILSTKSTDILKSPVTIARNRKSTRLNSSH